MGGAMSDAEVAARIEKDDGSLDETVSRWVFFSLQSREAA